MSQFVLNERSVNPKCPRCRVLKESKVLIRRIGPLPTGKAARPRWLRLRQHCFGGTLSDKPRNHLIPLLHVWDVNLVSRICIDRSVITTVDHVNVTVAIANRRSMEELASCTRWLTSNNAANRSSSSVADGAPCCTMSATATSIWLDGHKIRLLGDAYLVVHTRMAI